jgi:hypothetical protein
MDSVLGRIAQWEHHSSSSVVDSEILERLQRLAVSKLQLMMTKDMP